jgi:hypothetical protein
LTVGSFVVHFLGLWNWLFVKHPQGHWHWDLFQPHKVEKGSYFFFSLTVPIVKSYQQFYFFSQDCVLRQGLMTCTMAWFIPNSAVVFTKERLSQPTGTWDNTHQFISCQFEWLSLLNSLGGGRLAFLEPKANLYDLLKALSHGEPGLIVCYVAFVCLSALSKFSIDLANLFATLSLVPWGMTTTQ